MTRPKNSDPEGHRTWRLLRPEETERRRTKRKRPRSNGFVEGFRWTLSDEHLLTAGRIKARIVYQVLKSGLKEANKGVWAITNTGEGVPESRRCPIPSPPSGDLTVIPLIAAGTPPRGAAAELPRQASRRSSTSRQEAPGRGYKSLASGLTTACHTKTSCHILARLKR